MSKVTSLNEISEIPMEVNDSIIRHARTRNVISNIHNYSSTIAFINALTNEYVKENAHRGLNYMLDKIKNSKNVNVEHFSRNIKEIERNNEKNNKIEFNIQEENNFRQFNETIESCNSENENHSKSIENTLNNEADSLLFT